MKFGLFAALAIGAVALVGSSASAGVATSGLAKANVAPAAASSVKHVGWRCYRRCRWHGGGVHFCRHRCY
jgi:hypothetical protein